MLKNKETLSIEYLQNLFKHRALRNQSKFYLMLFLN